METPEVATEALEGMNNVEIDGRRITVEKARRSNARSPTPGKYLGSDRLRRAISSRGGPGPVYGGYGGGYGRGGSKYTPYPNPGYSGYGYGAYPSYGSYPRSNYPPPRYGDRYSPYRRDRSPIHRDTRDRYSPPPYRRDARDHSPYYPRERSPRSRSRSRDRYGR